MLNTKEKNPSSGTATMLIANVHCVRFVSSKWLKGLKGTDNVDRKINASTGRIWNAAHFDQINIIHRLLTPISSGKNRNFSRSGTST